MNAPAEKIEGVPVKPATLAAAVSAARRCRREKAGEPANG
jgi:hypothetical protein